MEPSSISLYSCWSQKA